MEKISKHFDGGEVGGTFNLIVLPVDLVEGDSSAVDDVRLQKELSYQTGGKYDGKRLKIVVPAGYTTDGATVPRLFWTFITPLFRGLAAAIVHDWLYMVVLPQGRLIDGVALTRKQCDDIFREGLAACGVPRVKRWLMYRSVRCFGWFYVWIAKRRLGDG